MCETRGVRRAREMSARDARSVGSAGRELLKAREAPIQDYQKVFQTRCAIETARSAGRGEDERKYKRSYVQRVLVAFL